MRFELEHLGTVTPFELSEGQHLLGGGPEDQVQLEGLPPALLTLRIESQRVLMEAARTLTVNEVFVPPGVSRLMLPGETVGLSDAMRLRLLSESADARGLGTVAVLKGLLTRREELAPSRAATLTCLTGLDVGRTHALAEARTELGRGSEVALRLRDRAVSRTHARVVQDARGFAVEDLGSPNGAFVNGRKVDGRTPLADGDVIELGRTLLRFQAPVSAPARDDTPESASADAEETPGFEASERDVATEPVTPSSVEVAAPTTRDGVPGRGDAWLLVLSAVAALAGLAITWMLASG